VTPLKAIYLDLFNTLVPFRDVPRDERQGYADQLEAFHTTGVYKPLVLPESWGRLSAYSDVFVGLKRLRERFLVATLSNGPARLQARILNFNRLGVDAVVPLEHARVYKPDDRAYRFALDLLGVAPAEAMMVTANRTFGDLEAADRIGMRKALIRDPEHSPLAGLHDLARSLGC
jgi:2-haloacid dehalogenase